MRTMFLALVAVGALTLGLPVASAQSVGPDLAGPSAWVTRDSYAQLSLYDYCEWGGDTQFCTSFYAREYYEEETGRFQFTALLLYRQVTAPTYNFMRHIVCRVPRKIIRLTAEDASFPLTALDPSSESCSTGGYRYDCDENGENCTYDGNYGYTNVIWVEGAWNKPVYVSSGEGVNHTSDTLSGDRWLEKCTNENRYLMTEGGLTWGASAPTRFIPFGLGVFTQFDAHKCQRVGK